jgi:hypothetical protein
MMSYRNERRLDPYRNLPRFPRLYHVMGMSLTAREIVQGVAMALGCIAALPCFYLFVIVLMGV